MKKLLIISTIVGIVALTSNQSNAQVSLNVNIGTQPAWVPVGYQNVNYYYLPEVQSYYYVPQRQFVYLSGNRWTRSRNLPARYRGYDLNHGRKVVVYGNNPYRNYSKHSVRYARQVNYYGGGSRVFHNEPRRTYKTVKYINRGNEFRGRDHHDKGRGRGRH